MKKGSIVIIDDDNDFSECFSDYLSFRNFEVLGRGKDGFEAVQLYEKLHPDIVLLDINMPRYDGFYGLEKIMKLDSKAKIILLTGHKMDVKKELLALYDVPVLQKPSSINQIEKTLDQILKIGSHT